MTESRDKPAIRERILKLRQALPAQEHARLSRAICRRFAERFFRETESAGKTGLAFLTYMPFRGEPDVTPLMKACWRQGIAVWVPRSEKDSRRLHWHRICSFADLEQGAYGILEPRRELPVLDENRPIGWILVPGVAFDESCGRMGYGGGYYDRFLAELARRPGPRPVAVAAAFELQVLPVLPLEAHDMPLDAVVTEERVLEISRGWQGGGGQA
jgi:5-formyltetrahydrofolate cyclo-ligase